MEFGPPACLGSYSQIMHDGGDSPHPLPLFPNGSEGRGIPLLGGVRGWVVLPIARTHPEGYAFCPSREGNI